MRGALVELRQHDGYTTREMAGRTKIILDKVVEKVTDKAFDAMVALPVAVTVWAIITGAVFAFMRRDFTLAGWQLSALVAGLIVLLAVSVALWVRVRSHE